MEGNDHPSIGTHTWADDTYNEKKLMQKKIDNFVQDLNLYGDWDVARFDFLSVF